MQTAIEVTSFYRFLPLSESEIAEVRLKMETFAEEKGVRGLIILAPEGINGTIAASSEAVSQFKSNLNLIFGNGEWRFKDSFCSNDPFPRFRIKVREEIVTSRPRASGVKIPEAEDPCSVQGPRNHLSPEEWHHVLKNERDEIVLIDTRNRYETGIGMFEGAIDPQIDHFSEFPEFVAQSGIPKEKKVLMYCTGGIRCEKAILDMERLGYNNVYQLDGGILSYLEQYPHEDFKGECFVFDNRVAVDQNLSATRNWTLCPHCGQPGNISIACDFCNQPTVVCSGCLQTASGKTCSHDCAYKSQHHPSRVKARTGQPSVS